MQNKDFPKLRNCPFCGDNQRLNYVELSNGLNYIECERCGAAPHRLGAWNRETAVKYWNSVNRWVPCSMRLPEIDVDVIVFYPYWDNNPIQVAHLNYDKLTFELSDGEFNLPTGSVTHWMPLPEPPEKE